MYGSLRVLLTSFLALGCLSTGRGAGGPLAVTQPAAPVRATRATLNGMAVPQGQPTDAWFEWGADSNYGYATPPVSVGSGLKTVRVSAPLEGLTAGSVLHFRLVASNAVGVVFGADTLLTTGLRFATWSDPTAGATAPPSDFTNLVAVACGHGHGLVLRNDGTAVGWMQQPLYSSAQTAQASVPAGLSNVIAVAGGWYHSLALKEDGTVVAWGLYDGSSSPVSAPAGLSHVIAIAGGDAHSMALKDDGSVLVWGNNATLNLVPRNATNVVAIAAGSTHALALRADGNVVAWGTTFGSDPTPPATLSSVVAIASEAWHNLALRSDGTVVAWGQNGAGQCSVPSGLNQVVAVAAGFQHSLVLKADGTVVGWGDSKYVTNVPANLGGVVAIASGDYFSQALSPMNLPPKTSDRNVSGGVHRDLVIPLSGRDPNGDALTYRVTSLPTNGALFQFSGTGRGEAITTVDTPVTDALNRVVFAPVADAVGAPLDAFGYFAHDGRLGSVPALVMVSILPPPRIDAAGFQPGTSGGFQFSFTGLSNTTYRVLTSTNLVHWTSASAVTQPTPGNFQFLDAAPSAPCRFYRVVTP